jgi:hypothetical protein
MTMTSLYMYANIVQILFLQARPNLKKFRRGNPEYMSLLHEIYHEVAVDGTSAYVPGIEEDHEVATKCLGCTLRYLINYIMC